MRSGVADNLVLDVANAASNDVKTIVYFFKMNTFVYKILLYFHFFNLS